MTKIYLIRAWYSDNCTYTDYEDDSVWLDEVDALARWEECQKKWPAEPDWFWWELVTSEIGKCAIDLSQKRF